MAIRDVIARVGPGRTKAARREQAIVVIDAASRLHKTRPNSRSASLGFQIFWNRTSDPKEHVPAGLSITK